MLNIDAFYLNAVRTELLNSSVHDATGKTLHSAQLYIKAMTLALVMFQQ